MGFGKKDHEEKPKRKQVSEPKEFVPTTKEQWKHISKRARKHEEERESEKAAKREKEKTRRRFKKDPDGAREQLSGTDALDIRIFQQEFFEAIVKAIKDNGGAPPAYHAFEELREVRDGRFRFDMHLALARMSWMQHTKLIEAALGQSVPTRDWTEAWHAVCRLVTHCFDIRIDSSGNERIKNREALEDWPVPERKRAVKLTDEERVHKKDVPNRLERAKNMRKKKVKGKEDNMTLDMFEEDEKRRLKAGRKDDDEDDDEEVEDEEDEEEEDEEEESDDEDDEDDEDGRKSKSKKRSKSDDDEDDEEDEPKRKKENRKVSSKKSDKSEKSKKSKAEKKEKTSSSSGESKFKVTKKFKGGIKEEVQSLISEKGSTLEQIVKAAKAKKIDKGATKIKNYLNWLTANGYLKRV